MASVRSSKRLKGSDRDSISGESTSTAAQPHPAASSLSFEHFLKLPHELRFRILELACSSPSTPALLDASSASPATKHCHLDIGTTLSLTLTSRWFNAQATLLLWTSVVITRPSTLISLQRAVASRPQLGRLVKSLHVGPLAELVDSPAPVRLRLGYRDDNDVLHKPSWLICSSLRSTEEASPLPRRCEPGHEWSLEHPETDRRSQAIDAALKVIQQSLDVKLTRPKEGKRLYTVKTYEAQAALDLYLVEIRRREDEAYARRGSPSEDSQGNEVAYPALALLGATAEPIQSRSGSRENVFALTWQQLLRHLARPGSATNEFEHPLLLARSGMESSPTTSTLYRWQPNRVKNEPEDVADTFTSLGIKDIADPATSSLDMLDPALIHSHTAGSLLGLLRSVLALTPRLETLSLSSYLERAICGKRPLGPALKNLRSLSLGPPPPVSVWYGPLNLNGLQGLKKLRLCGLFLHGHEALEIGALEELEEVQLIVPSELPESEQNRFGCLLDVLVGRSGAAAEAALRQLSPQELHELDVPSWYWPGQNDPRRGSGKAQDRKEGCILVEVRLRSNLLQTMLNRAQGEEEREDWLHGRARGGQQHRLLLTRFGGGEGEGEAKASARQAMYNEGRECWRGRSSESGKAEVSGLGAASEGARGEASVRR